MRKESDRALPKRVRPIFLDITDLTGNEGSLGASLREELRQSKYLILICSRNSAKAKVNADGSVQEHWVNNEVLDFRRQGHGDRIIPFIVDGTPNASDPAEECFPPAIRELPNESQPLGISPAQDGNSRAVVRCVARLLELKFDDLWRRHERRRKQQLAGWCVMAMCLMLTMLWYWDRNYRVTTAYYADYIERWGVPEGVLPLDQRIVAKRNECYRFSYRGGRVLKVEHLNSVGELRDHSNTELTDRAALMDMTEGYRGSLKVFPEIKFYDQKRNLILTRVYGKAELQKDKTSSPQESAFDPRFQTRQQGVEPCIIEFRMVRQATTGDSKMKQISSGNLASGMMSDQGFTLAGDITSMENGLFGGMGTNRQVIRTARSLITGKSLITRHALSYTNTGLVERVEFWQPEGAGWVRGCDSNQIYGFRYTHDAQGRVATVTYLDQNNEPWANRSGIGMKRYTRDPRWGDFAGIDWYAGADGTKLCINDYGFCRMTATFDPQTGNRTQESYFDADGNPYMSKGGYAGWTTKYDEHGNQTETAYFDVDGKPCLHKDGYARIERSTTTVETRLKRRSSVWMANR